MAKLVYLLWNESEADPPDLRARLVDDLGPRLLGLGPETLAVSVADPAIDASRSMPLARSRPALVGLVSLDLAELEKRTPFEEGLRSLGLRLAGYRVSESLPVDYDDRDWPDGEPTPGVKLVTLFDKPEGVSYEDFLAEWHGVHTPLSLEIHPLWRYVRNVVDEPITEGAPCFLGIVEEQFRTLEDVTDPERFYGGRENMKRVAEHITRFIRLDTMQTALMNETVLRSHS